MTFLCIIFSKSKAQNVCKWDTTKQFYQKFELSAKQKKLIEIKIPSGTTELLYRISILENNGNLTNSLSNLMGSIPYTPIKLIGNSINLLNGIGGNSKCEYLIFTSKEKANLFLKDKKNSNLSCYQSEKIIEHYNVLNLKHECLKKTKSIYLVLINTNLIEKSIAIVEAIPYVDLEMANGWSSNNKNIFLDNCKKIFNNSLENVPENCICVYNKIKYYTVSQYNALLKEEKNSLLQNNYKDCLKNNNNNTNIVAKEYDKAMQYFSNQSYDSCIQVLQKIIAIDNKHQKANQLLAKSYLRTKQFTQSLSLLSKLTNENPNDLAIQLDYAHALFLNGKFEEAKELYLQHKKENIDSKTSWIKQIKDDFEVFQSLGIESNKYNKILNIIE